MSDQEQILADLKVGDEVARRSGMGYYYLIPIRNISRGIIELENGEKYRVTNGTSLSKDSKWHRPDPIQPVTDEIRRAIKKAKLVNQLSGLNHTHWEEMDIETLEAINALIWKD